MDTLVGCADALWREAVGKGTWEVGAEVLRALEAISPLNPLRMCTFIFVVCVWVAGRESLGHLRRREEGRGLNRVHHKES